MTYYDILLAVSALWVVSELALGIRRRADRRALSRLWLSIAISCAAGAIAMTLQSASIPLPAGAALGVGVAMIVGGITLRWVAILTVRQIRRSGPLFDHGIYSVLRHPNYSGAWMAFVGLGLAFRNWISFFVLATGTLAAFLYRISVEEKALRAAYGRSYDEYSRRTSRMVPGVF